jgi:ribosomal protein S18 acetylase RimI-like enzyme
VNIRVATSQDEQAIRPLWEAFEAELPEPEGFTAETWDGYRKELAANIASGAVFVAEDADGLVGLAEAAVVDGGRWHLETVFVKPESRRVGVGKALVLACTQAAQAAGATHLSLGVLASNELAETVWRRLGFHPVELVMAQSLEALLTRLGSAPAGPSRATTHVQTDDRVSVDRAVAHFVPRLENVQVRENPGGWIRIVDPVLDADREAQDRFAANVSDMLGSVVVALALEGGSVVRFRLYERGRMVDEYLSVPGFYGDVDRGEELAAEANPTLVARLTGADRDEVRRVARTASSPGDLPAADQLYTDVGRLMGLDTSE